MRSEDIEHAEFLLEAPDFARRKHRRRGRAKAAGIRYERKMHKHWESVFGYEYLSGVWIRYWLRGEPRVRYAQIDGLLIRPKLGTITIVEAKYSHCPESYFQLVEKYGPLIEHMFGTKLWSIRTVTVVKWYDPAVAYPCPIRLRPDLESVRPSELAVTIWNPSSRR